MRTGVLVVIMLLATGCGGGAAKEWKGELRYVRSGGLGGYHDQLTVGSDRRAGLVVRRHGRRDFRLSEKKFNALADALEKADYKALPSRSTSRPPAPDAFTHIISYQGKQVITDDFSMPSGLRPLITELHTIVEEYRPN